jgi:hypothetical protein
MQAICRHAHGKSASSNDVKVVGLSVDWKIEEINLIFAKNI